MTEVAHLKERVALLEASLASKEDQLVQVNTRVDALQAQLNELHAAFQRLSTTVVPSTHVPSAADPTPGNGTIIEGTEDLTSPDNIPNNSPTRKSFLD